MSSPLRAHRRSSPLEDGGVTEISVDPAALGFAPATSDDLIGGDAAANAEIAHQIFAGTERGAKRDIVVLNAAAGLVAAGLADSLEQGVAAAAAAIDDGGAAGKLAAIAA